MEQAMKVFQGAIVDTSRRDFDLVQVPVEALPPPEVLGFRLEGDPKIEMRVLWVSEDKRKAVTVERLSPCRLIPQEPPGESLFYLFYFMEGRCTMSATNGETHTWKAGDLVFFTDGQYDDARVDETFLKIAFYSSTQPMPYDVTP